MDALLYLIAVATVFGAAEANIIKIVQKDESIQNFWDFKNFKSNINESCECGKFNPNDWRSPWNIYIHVKDNDTMTDKTCIGTVIASNLVVTSHKCLVLDGQRAHLYDVLKLNLTGLKDIAEADMIRVTDSKVFESGTKIFNVTDVIFNPQYVRSSQIQIYPENDLALIIVDDANFLAHPNYIPICIPSHDSESLGNVSGFYYGYTPEKEDKDMGNKPRRHFGEILEKRQCYKDLNIKITPEMKEKSYNKTLCFKFKNLDKHSKIEGGPLIYNFNRSSTKNNAFLFGVSTIISTVDSATGYEVSTGQENAYFSSMKRLAKFIEYYTSHGGHQSTWCKTPQLKQHKHDFSTRNIFNGGLFADWPWDFMNKTLERDDSLDCVCGINNNQIKANGRVVGGEEAVPREFGWLAQMTIYAHGKNKAGNLCGGSIINDRMILTAAHCVLVEAWMAENRRQVSVDPANINLQLNVHYKKGDKEAIVKEVVSVLFHPKYYYARRHGYFDMDIALLVLKDPLTFPKEGPGIRPICLPIRENYMEVVGKDSWVAGWGLTDPNNDATAANALQKIQLPVINMEKCRGKSSNRITDNFICAGTINRWHDAAAGDSGGPLMMEVAGQWYQIGLVSWGEDIHGSDTETLALYSDVQRLMPFVDYHSRRVHAKWCKMKAT